MIRLINMSMVEFIIMCLVLVLLIALALVLATILRLSTNLSDISDSINDLDLSELEKNLTSNEDLLELENTEYTWGHNVNHYHDDQE